MTEEDYTGLSQCWNGISTQSRIKILLKHSLSLSQMKNHGILIAVVKVSLGNEVLVKSPVDTSMNRSCSGTHEATQAAGGDGL